MACGGGASAEVPGIRPAAGRVPGSSRGASSEGQERQKHTENQRVNVALSA